MKFNADYNLNKFLKDKQTIRDKNKTDAIIGESSEIIEKIGESSSAKVQSGTVMMQNFFKEPTAKDPLSLISIFAKKHTP